MNYKKIIDEYKINESLRSLLMKLPIIYNVKDLYLQMRNDNIIIKTENVKELFMNMKGHIETVDVGCKGWSLRVKNIKVHNNNYSRDLACEFLFRILNNEVTNEDKPYLYNITLYILTHSHVFTNRIRHHIYQVISSEHFLSSKQKQRIENDMKNYGVIYKDCSSDEYDTESESEVEKYNSDNSDIGGYISD